MPDHTALSTSALAVDEELATPAPEPASWTMVGTASVIDALEKRGLEGVILSDSMGSGRFIGPALTVEVGMPAANELGSRAQHEPKGSQGQTVTGNLWAYLDSAPRGAVLLIGTDGRRVTVVGGVTVATALSRGLVAIATDGGIRDADEIREYGLPIRYSSTDPRAMRDRTAIRGCGGPLRFGTLQVEAGDIMVGDGDGVVRIPRRIAADVLEEARGIEHREQLWAQAARASGSIANSFAAVSQLHGSPH